MEQNDERWLPVVGWEGVYDVSDRGRVKRVADGHRTRIGHILEGTTNRQDNSRRVSLRFGDQKQLGVLISHLVAEAFISPRPMFPLHEINHLDGDRTNNRVDNLEWVTHDENVLHSYRVLGRVQYDQHGEANPGAKLTEADVMGIIHLCQQGMPQTEIADLYGVTQTNISAIMCKKSWRTVWDRL